MDLHVSDGDGFADIRMTLSFVDFNGIVPEKFDAVELSHMVDAE